MRAHGSVIFENTSVVNADNELKSVRSLQCVRIAVSLLNGMWQA